MAETIKVLAQSNPSALTLTDIYTVPAGKSTVVSSLVLANRSTSANTTFRLSLAIGGAVDALAQYLYYDVILFAQDTFIATIGVTLAATDVVRVRVNDAIVSVNVLGAEVS